MPFTEDSCLGESFSAMRSCFKEIGGEPGFIGVFVGKKKNQNKTVWLVLITKKQIFQVNDFSAFLYIGRYRF